MKSENTESGRGEVTRDIVVIGASADGLPFLRKLLAALPVDFPAAVFVVMHTTPDGPAFSAEILANTSPMAARFPLDRDPVEKGKILIAPPDHHLLLDPGAVLVVRGPRENCFRPAIDPLFRSAAVHYGPQVIAVLLGGLLDDGAAGLAAVRRCGGVTIVQDPAEANFPDRVLSARQAADPDYSARVDAMAALLEKLVGEPAKITGDHTSATPRLQIEADLAATRRRGAEELEQLGKASRFVCPECNGALWEIEDERILRFRCHIGHAFSSESLASEQSEAVERALGIALRTLDDTAALSGRLAEEARENHRTQSALIFQRRSEEAKSNADLLRRVIIDQQKLKSSNGEAR